MIEIDNTALHLLPVELIFHHPVYSAPLWPFRKLVAAWQDSRLTQSQRKQLNQLTIQADTADSIRTAITTRLLAAKEAILNASFTFEGSALRYRTQQPAELTTLEDQTPGLDAATTVMQYCPEETETAPNASSWQNWLWNIGRNFAYATGIALVPVACAGYLVDPFQQELTDEPTLNDGLTALPVYCLGTLLAYFGG